MINNTQNIFENFPLAIMLNYKDLYIRAYAKKYILLYNGEILWNKSLLEVKKNKIYIRRYILFSESDTLCTYKGEDDENIIYISKIIKSIAYLPNIVNKVKPSIKFCIDKIEEEIIKVSNYLEYILDKDIVNNFNIKKFRSKHLSFNSIENYKSENGQISIFCLHNHIKINPTKYENIIKDSNIYTKYYKVLNYGKYKSEKREEYKLRLYITYILFLCIEHIENYKGILQLCLDRIKKDIECINTLDESYLTFNKIIKNSYKSGNEILKIYMSILSIEKKNSKYYSCDCIQFKYIDNKWNIQFISQNNPSSKELNINKVKDNIKMAEFENDYIKST